MAQNRNPNVVHWTEYLVRFLSEDGAGTKENIRLAGERFTYAAENEHHRIVTWNEHTGLHTVTIATDEDAWLTIKDARARSEPDTQAAGGLDAIAAKHTTRREIHGARYHPVHFGIALGEQHARWGRGNYFPDGGSPRTYEEFEGIVTEGLDALDRRSLDMLSRTWRPGTRVLR